MVNNIERGLVDKYYEMDPDIEDLVFGKDLVDGMIVLISNPDHREGIHDGIEFHPRLMFKARKMNRWAEVTFAYTEKNTTRFVAVYADGTKMVQELPCGTGWYVKKNSILDKE